MELKGKTALVTGAAGDLGSVMLHALSARGVHVIALDNNKEKLAALPGSGVTRILCDAGNPSDVAKKMADIYGQHPKIDILVNAVGILYSAPLVNVMEKDDNSLTQAAGEWQKCLTVNLSSVFYISQWVARKMAQARTKGVIINISSVSANGNAGQSAYSASKAGVNALTQVWGKELGLYGIRVIAIAPGYIDTSSTRKAVAEAQLKDITSRVPLKKLGHPNSVAQTMLFAIENDYVNGTVLEVDGGLVV